MITDPPINTGRPDDKQLIERVARKLGIWAIPLEKIPTSSKAFNQQLIDLVGAVNAERRKDAVATFCSRRLEPRGTNEFWGLLRDGVSLEAGDELFLSPTPTIPEGMALIESSLLEMAIDLTDEASNEDFTRQPLADELRGLHLMLAAAQGEK